MLTPRKPDAERARPNKYANEKKIEEQLPEWDGLNRGPELPEDVSWSDETVKWWDVWRRSPQAMLCSETDWQAMLVGARIHNRMHSHKEVSHTAFVNMSAELRRIVGSVGGSYEDRKNLGIGMRNDVTAHDEISVVADETVAEAVDYVSRMAQRQAQAKRNAS